MTMNIRGLVFDDPDGTQDLNLSALLYETPIECFVASESDYQTDDA